MIAYYKQQIEKHSDILKKYRLRRNILTTIKVVIFCSMLYFIYRWATTYDNNLLWVCGIDIALLIILSVIDNKLVHIINITTKHIELYNSEIKACGGEFSHFDNGEIYYSAKHPFSYDLDIFGKESLFQHLNRTVTQGGSDKLADYLSNTKIDKEEIYKRQQAIKELSEIPDFRFSFLATGAHYKTPNNIIKLVEEWSRGELFFGKRWMRVALYAANTITILSWVGSFLEYYHFIFAVLLSILQMMASLMMTKRISIHQIGVDKFLRAIGNYTYLVDIINNQEFSSDRMAELKERLKGEGGADMALKSLKRIATAIEQRLNLLAFMILDGLFMKSIHNLIALDRWRVKYASNINQWVDVVSSTDTLISMANFAYNNPTYTYPVVDESVKISAKDLCHPLLKGDNKVTNNFNINSLHELRVITGANMAGKSTFLRSVGINMVLASAGSVVFSSDFRFTPMELFTSMRTTDDLSQGSSYFHAELMRLKQLITTAESGDGVFIILDEILKGTNSVDKLNGSRLFLKRILPLPISGIIATHDLALGELTAELPDNFKNLCFEIVHEGEDIIYDYKLKEGVSKTMNATILLSQLGLI